MPPYRQRRGLILQIDTTIPCQLERKPSSGARLDQLSVRDLVWIAAFLLGAFYPFLQVWAILRWHGVIFLLGLVPLVAMGWAVPEYQEAVRQESNLAPVIFIVVAPPCGLWLVILSFFRR